MTATADEGVTVKSTIRHGMSWADQQDSPGWVAKSPPKFSEELPEIVLDEQEFDSKTLDRTASSSAHTLISVYVGGLDYAVESKELEEFFKSKSIRVTRVRIQKNPEGKSAGRAFLNVYDQGALDAILKFNGSMLRGRLISVREDIGPKPVKSVAPADRKKSQTKRGDKKSTTTPIVQDDAPIERKKLELKPRTKPLESISTNSSARSSAIFGGAKPRDEFAFEQRKPSEPKSVAPKVVEQPQQPVVSKPKKTTKNRFAIDSDDSSSDEE
jgi:RNA recognition motif-containing protein